MQAKTIEKTIRKKVKEWIASIKDNALRDSLLDEVVVTGGCIVSMLKGESVNDFDIYFKTEKTARAVAEYYMKAMGKTPEEPKPDMTYGILRVTDNGLFEGLDNRHLPENPVWDHLHLYIKSGGHIKDNDAVMQTKSDVEAENDADIGSTSKVDTKAPRERYRPLFISSNAITLSNKVQLIVRFTGSAEQIHEYFDYVHCTCSWTNRGGLVLPQEALLSMMENRLRYVGSKYPLCSIFRSRKYIQRGWNIDVGQYTKMALQLNTFDLTDPRVLQDQLVGVDSTYFAFMLEYLLREDKLTERGFIDTDYALTLITRIFDEGSFDPSQETETN